MSSLYTLTLRGDGSVELGDDPVTRLELAVGAIETIAAADEDATVAMPAGLVRGVSSLERDDWAERLAGVSRELGVGLLFGIDIEFPLDEEYIGARYPRSFAFAFDRGRRALWASTAAQGDRKEQLLDRPVEVGGRRLVVLLQSDLFRPAARHIVGATRPELVVILAHGGPTPRWQPSMQALEALAPVLVVSEEHVQRKRSWSLAPRGWQSHPLVATSFVTIHRFTTEEAVTQALVSE